jgi:hypothetical protein
MEHFVTKENFTDSEILSDMLLVSEAMEEPVCEMGPKYLAKLKKAGDIHMANAKMHAADAQASGVKADVFAAGAGDAYRRGKNKKGDAYAEKGLAHVNNAMKSKHLAAREKLQGERNYAYYKKQTTAESFEDIYNSIL